MKLCLKEATKKVNKNTTYWLQGNAIFNKYIQQLGLQKYVCHHFSNPDYWELVELHRNYSKNIDNSYFVFHWMNEMWRYVHMIKTKLLKVQLMQNS